ncbi:hypothetical protein EYF80_050371 [Liparis tanakae]|uniref:Uncharacterized protein n=1 Tax=Liparis tanakae TaxID=230148 RepID=A0A4Z2FE04_9TELE|nr:hypothetical protein EYF80_050371 [Liparis tanakae]
MPEVQDGADAEGLVLLDQRPDGQVVLAGHELPSTERAPSFPGCPGRAARAGSCSAGVEDRSLRLRYSRLKGRSAAAAAAAARARAGPAPAVINISLEVVDIHGAARSRTRIVCQCELRTRPCTQISLGSQSTSVTRLAGDGL